MPDLIGHPEVLATPWIPAFAGMTSSLPFAMRSLVIYSIANKLSIPGEFTIPVEAMVAKDELMCKSLFEFEYVWTPMTQAC